MFLKSFPLKGTSFPSHFTLGNHSREAKRRRLEGPCSGGKKRPGKDKPLLQDGLASPAGVLLTSRHSPPV